jgi:hypothetical protein
MAECRRGPSVPAMTSKSLPIPLAFAAVLAFDLTGLIVALATGLDDLGPALVVGTPLNAPFTFVAVQALAVLAATRYRAGAATVAVLCLVSVVSGFADGGYGYDGLTAAETGIQAGIVVSTVILGGLAAAAAARPRRRALAVG